MAEQDNPNEVRPVPNWGLPPGQPASTSAPSLPQDPSFLDAAPVDTAPPISIAHLLVLTTCFGVCFGLDNLLRYFETNDQSNQIVQAAFTFIAALSGAITFAGPWLLYQIKQRTGKFFVHGGHWMLVYLMLTLAVGYGQRLVISFIRTQHFEEWALNIFFGVSFAFSLIDLALSIVLIILIRGHWRWMFLATAIAAFLALLSTGLQMANLGAFIYRIADAMYFVGLAIITLTFFVLLVINLVGKKRQDWIHWVAVTAFGISVSIVPLILTIYYRLFFNPV